MEYNEFEVIQTLVTLVRSGAFHKKEPLFERMYELFPELNEQQLNKVVWLSFGNMYLEDRWRS